ncbi:MAG: sensor histidine kinase [Sarcina sp.]
MFSLRKKLKMPISIEIALGTSLVTISLLVIYTVVQLIALNYFFIATQRGTLKNRYSEIQYLLSQDGNIDDLSSSYKVINIEMSKNHESFRIYLNTDVVYQTDFNYWKNIYFYENYSSGLYIDTYLIDYNRYLVLSSPILINGKNYMIQIIQPVKGFDDFLVSFLPKLIISMLLAILLSITMGIYLSKHFVRKLKRLSVTMKKIKENNLKERIEISEVKDEFDDVNKIFNSMMDELESVFNDKSRFVSDASHELRTPLTALQGHLKLIKRWGKNDKDRLEKSLDICLEEVERLNNMVNTLLVLSKKEKEEFNINKVPLLSPERLIFDLVEHYQILDSSIEFNLNIEKDILVKIQKDDLKQLLLIFIDNAIKYNDKENKKISISLSSKEESFILSFKDNGMGISKENLPFIQKRFYRADKARTGDNKSFGLGLSIAKTIIKNYKGKIDISSELSIGTNIIIEFPL